jgi:AraC-like DNA-binding protein
MISSCIRQVAFLMLICLGTSAVSFAQKNATQQKIFDSVYYNIATTLAATNVDRAIQQADSLLAQSGDSLQKLRSLMLLATLKKRTGQYTDALVFAMQGETLAGKTGNDEWRLRISGFLSTTFRELGLITEGKKYIGIAQTLAKTKLDAPLMRLFIHQEKAYYEINLLRYKEALQEIKAAINLLPALVTPHNTIPIATCYQLAGFCYLQLDSFVQADHYLKQGLQLLADQETELKGFIYQNLGELSLQQKTFPAAKNYLDSAIHYIRTSDNFNLKLATYKSLQDYYALKGDNRTAIQFQSQYTGLLQQQTALTNKVSNQLIERFGNELKKKTIDNYILYTICIGLIAILILSFFYTKLVRKKERSKYLAYLDKLNKQAPVQAVPLFDGISSGQEPVQLENVVAEEDPGITDDDQTIRKGLVIPKETEQRLLNGLAKVEEENTYLGKEMTLPFLASILKTNTKYLSAVINKHKEKDFNGYVNDWRINYIVDKLRHDTNYQQYKIAHLAEECGFSTHSKFTAAFKNTTGVSPSVFIDNLKRDQQKLG